MSYSSYLHNIGYGHKNTKNQGWNLTGFTECLRCSKDDEPGGGEGAMYQVTVQQSGDYRSYIKSVVVAANGTSVINENTNEKFKGTAILDDDALAVPSVTLSTEGSAIEFAVSGGVVDGDDAVVNKPMQWVVVVRKNGKEIDRKTLTFEDGKQIATDDLKLYYK